MLVLSRKGQEGLDFLMTLKGLKTLVEAAEARGVQPEETAVGFRLTVVEIDRGKIRVGIEAPPEIKVYRSELLDQKKALAG